MKFLKILLIVIVSIAVLLGILLLVNYFLFTDYIEYGYDDIDETSNEYYEDESLASDEQDTNYENPTVNYVDANETLDVLIVLVEFKNQEITTKEKSWYDQFWGQGKTVENYFADMSKGKLKIAPVNETYGEQNDGIITVYVDVKHPNVDSEASERKYDKATNVFEETIYIIDPYIDFKSYDDNNDGVIQSDEIVMVMVYAGYEENEFSYNENQSSAIHISDYGTDADDVAISDYIIYGELTKEEDDSSHISTMGTICHEMAHALGLPDLYDTDYSSIGLGFHSLMSEGNDNKSDNEYYGMTPAPIIAWSREYLGFIEAQEISDSGTYTLYAQSTSDYNIIKIDIGDIHYLLENIDFNGYGRGLDTYMNQSGVAIWRIDESVVTQDNINNNIINDDEENRGVTLIEASGTEELFEEELDYYREDYEHYFAKGYYDKYTLEDGTKINIISEAGKKMDVSIEF